MMEWQPISTAPKDGTFILAWAEYCGGGEQVVVQYRKPKGRAGKFGHFVWAQNINSDGDAIAEKVVTRWMPLPAPPKETE